MALRSASRVSSILGSGWLSLNVYALSFLKSGQNLTLPSFFVTITTLLHQGLKLGSITPRSAISFISASAVSRLAKGILYGLCLIGFVSLVSIVCSTNVVSPISLSELENVSWCCMSKVLTSCFWVSLRLASHCVKSCSTWGGTLSVHFVRYYTLLLLPLAMNWFFFYHASSNTAATLFILITHGSLLKFATYRGTFPSEQHT